MCTSRLNASRPTSPEERLYDILLQETNVAINPQVIKLIVKYRWDEIAKAAHEIHEAA